MKNRVRLLLTLVLVIGLLLTNISYSVVAQPIPSESNSLAPGNWNFGTNTEAEAHEYPAPDWLQLLAKPVRITESGKLCHDFRGGQFGWVGEIRQLVDGKWVKLKTTSGWEPSVEGKYVICAEAPSEGVYALFGYYSPQK